MTPAMIIMIPSIRRAPLEDGLVDEEDEAVLVSLLSNELRIS